MASQGNTNTTSAREHIYQISNDCLSVGAYPGN